MCRILEPAPHWSAQAVVDGAFEDVSLTDYKGKFLVMVFYPADFTYVLYHLMQINKPKTYPNITIALCARARSLRSLTESKSSASWVLKSLLSASSKWMRTDPKENGHVGCESEKIKRESESEA